MRKDQIGRRLRLDRSAKSASRDKPAFIARPFGAPVYHGFPVVPESETDGWFYGAITEYKGVEPQDEGDGYVIAPDGSRAGIAWATDTPEFYEILPPDKHRWRVYGICFSRPVASVEDLVFNFRAALPMLKEKYESLQKKKR